ncbi:hypothetical protein RHSIM_Rhsim08G0149300 [Rhododendron simsii]|uniref:Uncharacterized protein n=1 Tax=Rhododendron simsii TaxID=118357 RepID=A0A834GKZ1_RHOSS|nr:hypothetical protein RHSIM_Rhsim08G0149300 [Rhododendron simsii]
MITDLHVDLLKCIMILMVKSSDGATNLARAISVCSVFSKVADDTDVLKAVCFQGVSVYNRCGLFQQTNGLIHRCAQVGNAAAQYLLAKVILMSSSQLLATVMKVGHTSSGSRRVILTECLRKMPRDDAQAANFMTHFAPDQACSTKNSTQTLLHSELVRNFLCQCSAHETTLMHLHLNDYVDCFSERGSRGNFVLHYLINKMCHYGHRVRALEDETLEDKREMKEVFMENMERLTAWKKSRQSNQGVVPGGNLEDYVQPPEEEWYLRSNRVFAHQTYASIEELLFESLDVLSEFEDSRISALACFCHVFP